MIDPSGRLGQQIGEYRLFHYLGEGNFGTVYLAEHLHDHSRAAVKVLQLQFTNRSDLQDFLNEARIMRLRHPHIVPILDFGMSDDGSPFLVMAYAAGGTLRNRHAKGEKVPVALVDTYVQQIASALQYAHDRHIIHQDVKPENMLLYGNDTVQLSDFGIAKISGQGHLNNQAIVRGTPAYMAPEQSDGKSCPASDQYALAIVVYEWLTGQRPFNGTPLEILFQHNTNPPLSLCAIAQEISPQVEQVVLKALAKVPEERFPTVADFSQALHQAIQDANISQEATWDPGVFSPASASQAATVMPSETLALSTADQESFSDTNKNLSASPPTPIPTSLTKTAVATPNETGHVAWPEHGTPSSTTQKTMMPGPFRKHWRRMLIACLCLLLVIGAGSGGIWLFVKQQAQQHALAATATQQALVTTATQRALAATATQQRALASAATATVRAYSARSNFFTNAVVGLTAASVNGQAGVYLAWLNSQTAPDGRNHIDIASTPTGNASDFTNRVELTDSSSLGPGICSFNGRLYVTFQGGEAGHPIHIAYFNGSNLLANGTFVKDSSGVLQTTWSRPTCAAYNGLLYVAWAGTDTHHDIHLISSTDGQNFGAVMTFAHTVGCADPFPLCNSTNAVPTAPFLESISFPGQDARLYIAWHASSSNAIKIGYYDAANPSDVLQGFTTLADNARADLALQTYNNQLWLGWGAVASALLQAASSTDGISFPDNRNNPCNDRGAFAAAFASFNGHLYMADDVNGNGIGYCQLQ